MEAEVLIKMYIEAILMILLVLGIVVLYQPELLIMYSKVRNKMCLSFNGLKTKETEAIIDEEIFKAPSLKEALKRVLNITFGIGSNKMVLLFWCLSTVLPLIFFWIMANKVPLLVSILGSVLVGLAPTLILLGKLQTLRISSSKEGGILLTELLDNYKMNYFNMQHAIEVTAVTIKGAPNCKRLLLSLSKGINRANNNEEVKKILEDFKFAIGTSWASILVDNMNFALSSGIKVTEAMEDLIKTVEKAKAVEEYAKRENNESKLILKYLAPGCYLLTVIGGIKYFGITTTQFIQYQFETAAGFGWFMISLLTYTLSLVIKFFLTRDKLDL